MEIRHPAVAIALLVTFGAPVPGKADKIDDYVTAQIKRLHVPGTSLAVVRDGHITKAQGYGFANLELRSPATKETVYEIGSTSKHFGNGSPIMASSARLFSLTGKIEETIKYYAIR